MAELSALAPIAVFDRDASIVPTNAYAVSADRGSDIAPGGQGSGRLGRAASPRTDWSSPMTLRSTSNQNGAPKLSSRAVISTPTTLRGSA